MTGVSMKNTSFQFVEVRWFGRRTIGQILRLTLVDQQFSTHTANDRRSAHAPGQSQMTLPESNVHRVDGLAVSTSFGGEPPESSSSSLHASIWSVDRVSIFD